MTTKTDVINEALGALGQPSSSGPNDSSSWVRKVVVRYNSVVRLLLEDHPWNFASGWVQLQQTGATPIGRQLQYNKPSDFLRINMINDTGNSDDMEIPDYDDEGGYINADMDPCFMSYISSAWITKEGSWPQKFARAVAFELASTCSEVTSKQLNKGLKLEEAAAKALQKAKSWDASQKPFRRLPGGLWARARHGGTRYRTDG